MTEFNTIFLEKTCKKCGIKVEPVTTGDTNPDHGYKLFCPYCNFFVGWGGKVQTIKNSNGKRERSSMWTAKRLGFGYCQCCLRKKDHLGVGTLEVHHVIEISDGGEDVPDNIHVLCTACHKHVHYSRTYLNDHLKTFYPGGDNEKQSA